MTHPSRSLHQLCCYHVYALFSCWLEPENWNLGFRDIRAYQYPWIIHYSCSDDQSHCNYLQHNQCVLNTDKWAHHVAKRFFDRLLGCIVALLVKSLDQNLIREAFCFVIGSDAVHIWEVAFEIWGIGCRRLAPRTMIRRIRVVAHMLFRFTGFQELSSGVLVASHSSRSPWGLFRYFLGNRGLIVWSFCG